MWFGFAFKPYTGVGWFLVVHDQLLPGEPCGVTLATTRGTPQAMYDGDCVAYDNQAKETHVAVSLIQREVGDVCVDSVGLHCYRASGALLPGERW